MGEQLGNATRSHTAAEEDASREGDLSRLRRVGGWLVGLHADKGKHAVSILDSARGVSAPDRRAWSPDLQRLRESTVAGRIIKWFSMVHRGIGGAELDRVSRSDVANNPLGPDGRIRPSDDPFADEREELTSMLYGRPRWLTQMLEADGQRQDTWYVGPRGPNVVDLVHATDEEFAKYERLAEMLEYDDNLKKHERDQALGLSAEAGDTGTEGKVEHPGSVAQ